MPRNFMKHEQQVTVGNERSLTPGGVGAKPDLKRLGNLPIVWDLHGFAVSISVIDRFRILCL